MEKALQADDLDAWARPTSSFHEQLVSMAGNKLLQDAVEPLGPCAPRPHVHAAAAAQAGQLDQRAHGMVERCAQATPQGRRVNREHRQRASRELLAIFERFRCSRCERTTFGPEPHEP
jgi:DNA-binding GntR family transcriptional regulator